VPFVKLAAAAGVGSFRVYMLSKLPISSALPSKSYLYVLHEILGPSAALLPLTAYAVIRSHDGRPGCRLWPAGSTSWGDGAYCSHIPLNEDYVI